MMQPGMWRCNICSAVVNYSYLVSRFSILNKQWYGDMDTLHHSEQTHNMLYSYIVLCSKVLVELSTIPRLQSGIILQAKHLNIKHTNMYSDLHQQITMET
jgi:hypothetical protein